MFVAELTEGTEIDQPLLVREASVRSRQDGTTYLRLVLGDRSGSLPAIVREDVEATAARLPAGTVARVRATVQHSPRFGPDLLLTGIAAAAPGTYDEALLVDGPPRAAEQMEADLRELVATIQHPDLRRLCDAFLAEGSEAWRRFAEAPAAKRFHQAYRHGLLEHSLTVAQAVSAMAATFPGIDRDVAVTGALLHDIGKLEAYAMTGPPADAIDMTDAGRLQGEIPLGYYAVRRTIEDLDGFDAATAQAVLHIILSHHGSLEHGSPVLPVTREATLVHFCDNLGGRLGSFDRLEKTLIAGTDWSGWDRAIGSAAFFGPTSRSGPDAGVRSAA